MGRSPQVGIVGIGVRGGTNVEGVKMKDLAAVRVILKTALASRLAEPCSPGRCAESYQSMETFGSFASESQESPYSRRYPAVSKDSYGRRRDSGGRVATMGIALHRGRVRRRPKVNGQVEDATDGRWHRQSIVRVAWEEHDCIIVGTLAAQRGWAD